MANRSTHYPGDRKNLTRRGLLACACAFVLSSCAASTVSGPGPNASAIDQSFNNQPASRLQRQTNVKVALLLPLTGKGNTAKTAQGLKQAGELALFEFDKPNVVLITKDTKGTPEGARAAAQAALSEGAELVIGPLFSKSVTAAASVTRPAGVPMIAFSSDRAVAGNGVYLLSFLAGQDVPRILSYAVGAGKQNFAALVPDTQYGKIVENSIRLAASRIGANIATIERYPADANGMLEPARRVKQVAINAKNEGRPVDALLIPAGKEALPTLATLMPYFEIDTQEIKLLGTGDWDYAAVGREAPLVGGWFPAPDPRGWRDFTQRYAKTYGGVPPRIASLAYDAVSLAVSLSNNPSAQRYTATNLTRSSGFAGVDGLFRLKADGTSERGLAILEVQKFGSRVIQPAPSVFGSSSSGVASWFSN